MRAPTSTASCWPGSKRPNLTPSPQAAPRALLRRLYYDLIGLPPTADELDEFAADPSDARYEAAVDRLLASPRFGERWARHWLDIARYADTKGYVFEEDRNYKHAYTYRDWVIASFNADRPFDQFVVAQLAADQIDDPILCAGDRLPHAGPPVPQQQARHHQRPHRRRHARPDGPDGGLRPLPRSQVRSDQRGRLLRDVRRVRQLGGKAARRCAADARRCRDAVRSVRLSARQCRATAGPNVERRFLTMPGGRRQAASVSSTAAAGCEMAEAIASRDNPLTARVWVNRVWGTSVRRSRW